jgi:tetratricopeptide (TPR) repeat protein
MSVRAAVALVCLLTALMPGAAIADEGDAFYAAVALERAGKYAEAAAAHEAIAARAPDDPFADDALMEAARLYEEKLDQPRRAAETYERVARSYPDGRAAQRAERRARLLREGLGTGNQGEAALAAWNDILNRFPTRSRPESVARAEKLLAAHPDWVEAPRVLHWIGEQEQQLGQHERALATFAEVQERWPGGDWALRARRSQADVLTTLGRYHEAEAVYASLRGARTDAPYAKELAEAVVRLHEARAHARLETAAWVALALLLAAALVTLRRDAGSFAEAGRALARPPLEAIFLLPIAGLIALAGHGQSEPIARATLWLGLAMLLVAWLTGAGLVTARRALGRLPLTRVALFGAGGGTAMLAAAYVIVRHTELLDFIIHTVRFGVD